MKRLSVVIALAVVSLVAGVAIAGLPSSVPDDVVIPEPPAATTTTTTVPATLPTTIETDDSPSSTASETSSPTTSTDEPTADTTAPTSPDAASLTSPDTTPTSTTLADVAGLRVAVVNATALPGLAANTATVVSALGYPDPIPTDALDKDEETSFIYFENGRRAEAERLAAQIGLDQDDVAPEPDEEFAVDDVDADLWLVVGADRVP